MFIVKAYNDRENEAWKRERFTVYMIHCMITEPVKRLSIYEFMRLDGDPTEEEEMKDRYQHFYDAYYKYEKIGALN